MVLNFYPPTWLDYIATQDEPEDRIAKIASLRHRMGAPPILVVGVSDLLFGILQRRLNAASTGFAFNMHIEGSVVVICKQGLLTT